MNFGYVKETRLRHRALGGGGGEVMFKHLNFYYVKQTRLRAQGSGGGRERDAKFHFGFHTTFQTEQRTGFKIIHKFANLRLVKVFHLYKSKYLKGQSVYTLSPVTVL